MAAEGQDGAGSFGNKSSEALVVTRLLWLGIVSLTLR